MDPTYFTTATTNFGPAEWVFFIAACAALGGGIYLALLRTDSNAARLQSLRQIGYALLAVGGTSILIGLIRLIGVAIAPFWFTIATVLMLAVAAYAAYVVLVQLPAQLAAAAQQRSRNTGRPATAQRATAQVSANRTNSEASAQPTLASGRRTSRRERKRRSK